MQLKEKTPFCPRTFPFRIKNNKKEIVLVALLLTKKNYVKTKKYSHQQPMDSLSTVQSCTAKIYVL